MPKKKKLPIRRRNAAPPPPRMPHITTDLTTHRLGGRGRASEDDATQEGEQMDYADVYYIDTRNADPRDHRTQVSGQGARPAAIVPAGTGVGRPVTGPQPM